MNISLIRKWFTDTSTISELSLNKVFECFILEDKVRAPGVKIDRVTAIPAGTYDVIVDYSNRFKRYMPHILNVVDFTGVRIHTGNISINTEGCLLTGRDKAHDQVLFSRVAYAPFFAKIAICTGFDTLHNCPIYAIREKTTITITNAPETDTRT